MRRLALVLGLVALLATVVGVGSAQASTFPPGCKLVAFDGWSAVGLTVPAGTQGHQVVLHGPSLDCTATTRQITLRTTWRLQRYFPASNLWSTELSFQVRTRLYSTGQDVPLNCVAGGSTYRAYVTWEVRDVVLKRWTYDVGVAGPYRVVCPSGPT
jgi:hypothetical protein